MPRNAYRAEVIGSLLRPGYLKDARRRHASGSITDAELKRAEDRAVDDAVRIQARAGVSVLTDGEMRRYAYFGHFIDSIEGFDKFGGWAIPFRDEGQPGHAGRPGSQARARDRDRPGGLGRLLRGDRVYDRMPRA
jgi:methionine synthase II (cobalamin-independent)